jgi:hypothetical protein
MNWRPVTQSMTRCKPIQMVLTPGSPSPLRARKPPSHGHPSQDLVESGWVSRRLLLVEEIGGMPFVLVEEQVGGQVWAGPAASHQHRNAPGHDQVQRDSALQAVDRPQLQGLDPAAVLEDVEEDLDLPTCTIPVNQFCHLVDRLGGGLVSRRHSTGVLYRQGDRFPWSPVTAAALTGLDCCLGRAAGSPISRPWSIWRTNFLVP